MWIVTWYDYRWQIVTQVVSTVHLMACLRYDRGYYINVNRG